MEVLTVKFSRDDFKPSDIERFNSKLKRSPNGCLLWTSVHKKSGYGRFEINIIGKKYRLASHRVAWILAGNEITDDKPYVLHDCPGGDNRACCEPRHLWVGTYHDNNEDSEKKGTQQTSARGLPKGVRVCELTRPYQATMQQDGAVVFFGTWHTVEDAGEITAAARRRRKERRQGRNSPVFTSLDLACVLLWPLIVGCEADGSLNEAAAIVSEATGFSLSSSRRSIIKIIVTRAVSSNGAATEQAKSAIFGLARSIAWQAVS